MIELGFLVNRVIAVAALFSFASLVVYPPGYLRNWARHITSAAKKLCVDAGYDYDDATLMRLSCGGLCVSVVFGSIVHPFAIAIFPLAVGGFTTVFLMKKKQTRSAIRSRNNDVVCFALARTLRSGQTLSGAIAVVSQQYSLSFLVSLDQLLHQGVSLHQALDVVQKHIRVHGDEKLMFASLSFAQDMGGNSARIFERIGEYFHSIYELGDDTKASLAQVQLSAWVVGLLPVIMLGISTVLGSQAVAYLLTHPLGWVCLVLGGGLEFLGVLWMRKLTHDGVGIWIS